MHAHPPSLLLLFFFLLLPTCTHTFASPNKKPRPKKITIDLGNNISSTTPSANTVWSSIDGNLRKEKEKPPKKKSNKNAKKEMIALQRSSTSTSSPSSPSPTVKVASRGNKKVTIVAPLSKLPRSPKEIFKLLKGKLGTGGTIMGDAVEIQGDHKTKVEVRAWTRSEGRLDRSDSSIMPTTILTKPFPALASLLSAGNS